MLSTLLPEALHDRRKQCILLMWVFLLVKLINEIFSLGADFYMLEELILPFCCFCMVGKSYGTRH